MMRPNHSFWACLRAVNAKWKPPASRDTMLWPRSFHAYGAAKASDTRLGLGLPLCRGRDGSLEVCTRRAARHYGTEPSPTSTGGPGSESAGATEAGAGKGEGDPSTSDVDAKVDEIMSDRSNSATRFVYLRTLPLREQEAFAGKSSTELTKVGETIEGKTRELVRRHLALILDGDARARVHVHTASLAAATVRVLHPGWIDDEARVLNMVRRAFGAPQVPELGMSDEERHTLNDSLTARPDYWVVRTALWFAFDKLAAVRKMTANMVSDFGPSFRTRSEDVTVGGLEHHLLYVDTCLYRDVCVAEGLPQLTSVFCALDRQIFAALNAQRHGIRFSLDRTLADADVPVEAGGGDDGDDGDKGQCSKADECGNSQACEFKFVKLKAATTK